MKTSIEYELAMVFADHQYMWMISDQLRVPNAKDIRMTIDEAKRVLDAEPVPRVSMNVGRLHIERIPTNAGVHYDVYVMIGDDSE